MKRIMIVPALLVLWAHPALAGEWDEYYSYERHSYEVRPDGSLKDYDAYPASREAYVADDYVVSDEAPLDYAPGCEVEQEWSPGRYSETVECEGD